MPSSHRVAPARCKRHGARMKQRSARPNTPQHPQPPSWRLAGLLASAPVVPSTWSHRPTPNHRQIRHASRATGPTRRQQAHLGRNRVLEVSSERLGLCHGMGWAGVRGNASISPPEAKSGRGAPWRNATPQPAMLRDLVGTLDRYAAQKQKDCVSGDVLRVGAARTRSPPDTRRRRETRAVQGDMFGPSAYHWVVRSPQRHVPDDVDVWGRRGWSGWHPSDHAHQE